MTRNYIDPKVLQAHLSDLKTDLEALGYTPSTKAEMVMLAAIAELWQHSPSHGRKIEGGLESLIKRHDIAVRNAFKEGHEAGERDRDRDLLL